MSQIKMSKFDYINEELADFTKKVEYQEQILDCIESGFDYIHNYLDSEARMLAYDPEWDFDSQWSEDLFIYLQENNPYYLFMLFQDILLDFPIEINEADYEVFVEIFDAIRHLLWYEGHKKRNT